MAEKVLSSRIIHKHDVAANWSKATNFVPKQGELIVYDIDADYVYERIKIGDGTKNVNALPFVDDALRASLLTEIGAVDDKVDAVSALVGDTAVSEQINAAVDTKMDKENPTGTGAFSLNRKEGTTVGTNSHTEGTNNTASGVSSHAEGDSVVSSGNNSHAEGSATKAIGAASHAEGLNTTASGGNAHAEGSGTQATNINAHAEGQYSKATGQASHAEGFFTNAIGGYSHSEGYYTSANSSHQHVQGKYNVIDSNATYAHVVGNGTSDSARSNAHTLDWDGNAWFQGTVKIGGASQDDETAKELATQEYVDTAIATIPAPDVSGSADTALANAKSYTDAEIAEWVGDKTVATQIESAVSVKSDVNHTHDDRYYTEEEIDESLKFIKTVSGEIVAVDDSSERHFQGLILYGKTTQDGTPTPEAPVPMVNAGAGGSICVQVCGKNLFDLSKLWIGNNVQCETNGNSVHISTLSATTYSGCRVPAITMHAGIEYVLSADVSDIVSGTPSLGFRDADTMKYIKRAYVSDGRIVLTYTPTETIRAYAYLLITGSTASDGDATFSNIQLEVGASATAYEPYKDGGSMTALTPNGLPGIPVTSGGNYIDSTGRQWVCDEIDYVRKVYVKRVHHAIYDGAIAPYSSAVRDNTIRITLYNNYPQLDANHKNAVGNMTVQAAVYYDDRVGHSVANDTATATGWHLSLPKDIVGDTVDSMRTWLQNNPAEVMYVMATPVETSLSSDELTGNAALTAHYPNTTVYNDAGAEMVVRYATNRMSEIDETLELSFASKANADDLSAHIEDKSNPHEVTLNQLGVTATATELNYIDGVTSNVQTQLNAKVPTTRKVNGKALNADVTLSASDVGADASGAANTALTNAKTYTNERITAMVGDDTVANQISSAVATKADTSHTHSAYVNQNAFSKVKVGETTVTADTATDTLTLAGSNVTLTPDATNDKVTIGITKANVVAALGYTPPTADTKVTVDTALSSTSTNPVQNKVVNAAISNLNTLVGDTAVSTQISNAVSTKSDTDHTHKYAGSSSAGGAATSANKLNTNAGSATNPVYFNNGIPVKTTHTLGTSVPADAKFTDTVYTHPTTSGNKHIPSGGSSGQILKWSANGTAVWGEDNNTTYSNATTSEAGLMSATDKTALNNLTTLVGDTPVSTQISEAIDDITLANLGVSATAAELNYMDGVTSNVQEQLDGKASLKLYSQTYTCASDEEIDEVLQSYIDDTTFTRGARHIILYPNASGTTLPNGTVYFTDICKSSANYGVILVRGYSASVSGGVKLYMRAWLSNELQEWVDMRSLGNLGITATAEELNYAEGLTSNIQAQLNAKVPTSRKVNGKALSSNITLSASDVGADASGSANTALANAKSYTDAEIVEWVGDKTVSAQIASAVSTKADVGHIHDDRYYTEEEIDDALNLVHTATGEVIAVNNSAEYGVLGLNLYGKTTQDGTPTPETPIDLVNAGSDGSITVNAVGKNMIDMSELYTSYATTSFEYDKNSIHVYTNADGTYQGVKSSSITLVGGVTYTLSATVTAIASGNIRIGFRRAKTSADGNSGQFISGTSIFYTESGFGSVTFTLDKNVEAYLSLLVTWSTSTAGDATFENVQLEVGDTATVYESYKDGESTTILVPSGLRGIPVSSGGNYTDDSGQQWISDVADFNKNIITSRMVEFVIDGRAEQSITSITAMSNVVRFWVYVPDLSGKSTSADKAIMCNKLPVSSSYAEDSIGIQNGVSMGYPRSLVIKLPLVAGTTEEKIQTYLAANPLNVVTVIDQVSENSIDGSLDNILCQHPVTTIFNNAGAGMSVDYATTRMSDIEPIFVTKNELHDAFYTAEETEDILKLVHTSTGDLIAVDSADYSLQSLTLYGKTTQDGTPTPESPVDLVSVGNNGSITVNVRGKNLFIDNRTSKADYTSNGITFTTNTDGTFTANGTNSSSSRSNMYTTYGGKWLYLPAGTYTLFADLPASRVAYFQISYNDEPVATGATGIYIYEKPVTLTFDKPKWCWLAVNVVAGATVENLVFKPQIEVGTIATAYEPYNKLQTMTVSTPNGLPGIKVESGGNYTDSTGQQWLCDEIDFKRWMYVKRIHTLTLDGSQSVKWYSQSSMPYGGAIQLVLDSAYHAAVSHKNNSVSDRFVNKLNVTANYTHGVFGITASGQSIFFAVEGVTSADAAKTWFTSNPTTIVYALATPTETMLPVEEIIAYMALNTYNPTTAIFNESDAWMEASYATNYMSNIEPVFATKNELSEQLNEKVPTTRRVNGKALNADITLSASDVGADVSGAANTALTNAKSYTDAEIATIVGDDTVANQISAALSNHTHTIADISNIVISDTEPTSPTTGMLWFDIS